jgi:hypothetical protein
LITGGEQLDDRVLNLFEDVHVQINARLIFWSGTIKNSHFDCSFSGIKMQ